MADPSVNIIINAVDQASQKLKGITGSFTEFNSALTLVGKAADTVKKVYAETIDVAYDYDISMRKLAQTLDIDVEQTSRLIQAGDDLGVSQDKLTTTLQFMSKAGIAPTIENLAKLSDELLAETDVTKRNEKAAKLMGRSWFEAAPFILAGGNAIRELAAAQKEGLVVTQEAADAAEEYRQNLDELNDTVETAKIIGGNEFIKVLNADVANFKRLADAIGMVKDGEAEGYIQAIKMVDARTDATDAIKKELEALQDLADGHDLVHDAIATTTIDLSKYITQNKLGINAQDAYNFSLAEGDKKMKELAFTMNTNLLDAQREFDDKNVELEAHIQEVIGKINILEKKRYLTKAQKKEMGELAEDLAASKKAVEDLAAAHDEATKRIVYDLIAQQMAADGVSDAEASALLAIATNFGLVDQSATNMWNSIMGIMPQLESQTLSAEAKVRLLQDAIDKLQGKDIYIRTYFEKYGDSSGEHGLIGKPRAAGGPVMAGAPYLVGERGPEIFVPRASGNITPNNQSSIGGSLSFGDIVIIGADQSPLEIADAVIMEINRRARSAGAAGLGYVG